MQRVAIARAIVNDPDIILADEPTGALDSDTSIQVMDILKKLSEKKLVVMVTHNPELAGAYATRIVTLADGKLTGDSAPYVSDTEDSAADKNIFEWYAPEEAVNSEDESVPKKKRTIAELLKRKCEKRTKIEKSSLSYNNALKLSWNNLWTKRGRTFLTSLAGSIGIIGIALVLALSSGFSDYIRQVEEESLSKYPLEINRSSFNVNEAIKLISEKDNDRTKYPKTDNVFIGKALGNLLGNLPAIIGENDLKSFKNYLETNFQNSSDGYVKYDYGAEKFIYSDYAFDGQKYQILEPFTAAMDEVLDKLPDAVKSVMNSNSPLGMLIPGFTQNMNAWDELIDNPQLLDQQYELLGGDWPDRNAIDEIVLVLDEYNQISDMQIFMLGLKGPDDVAAAITGNTSFLNTTFTVDELLKVEYKLLRRCDLFIPDPVHEGKFLNLADDMVNTDKLSEQINGGLTLKVKGVVRIRESATSGAINGVAGYTKALTEWLVTSPAESAVVKAQLAAYDYNLGGEAVIGTVHSDGSVSYDSLSTLNDDEKFKAVLKTMGYDLEELSNPRRISIYANSLESKQNIIDLIEHYNATVKEDKYIRYTDTLGLLMGAIEMILTSITYILIGFSAISLIVSSIMIAIITYTSVLERTKEIGILRSLGARKKDVARVFNSETSIIGVFSGIIGVIFVGILQVPVSILLESMLGIPNLMTVLWWHGILMVALSVVLSLISGIIPSQVAANKNPVHALKSE
jgi:putative ABC transport system permease protein